MATHVPHFHFDIFHYRVDTFSPLRQVHSSRGWLRMDPGWTAGKWWAGRALLVLSIRGYGESSEELFSWANLSAILRISNGRPIRSFGEGVAVKDEVAYYLLLMQIRNRGLESPVSSWTEKREWGVSATEWGLEPIEKTPAQLFRDALSEA